MSTVMQILSLLRSVLKSILSLQSFLCISDLFLFLWCRYELLNNGFLDPGLFFSHLTAHWYSSGDRKPAIGYAFLRGFSNESCYFQWPWRTVSLVSRRFRNVNFLATKLTSTGCAILSQAWKVVIRGPRTNDPPQNIPPYAVNRPRINDCCLSAILWV